MSNEVKTVSHEDALKSVKEFFDAALSLEGTPGECPRVELVNAIRETKRIVDRAKPDFKNSVLMVMEEVLYDLEDGVSHDIEQTARLIGRFFARRAQEYSTPRIKAVLKKMIEEAEQKFESEDYDSSELPLIAASYYDAVDQAA